MLAKKILGNASKNVCMVGKLFQEFFFFLMNGERGCRLELIMHEYIEMDGSAQNGSKTSCKRQAYPYIDRTIPYRTFLKSHVNAARVLSAFYVIHVGYIRRDIAFFLVLLLGRRERWSIVLNKACDLLFDQSY